MNKLSEITRAIGKEIQATVARPSRVRHLFSIERLKRYVRFHQVSMKASGGWQSTSTVNVTGRRYKSYEDYIELQALKLDYIDLRAHEKRFRSILKQRLQDLEFICRGQSVLCLGARLGAEVRAFIDVGCFAVGIDLNPGEHNPYVLYGDFHNLPMADSSVDVVYSNSIDHAFELDGMVAEIIRVLRPDGHIILEPDPGTKDVDGIEPDLWAAQSWTTIDNLIKYLEELGLKLTSRRPFEYPRNGEQLIFRPLINSVD